MRRLSAVLVAGAVLGLAATGVAEAPETAAAPVAAQVDTASVAGPGGTWEFGPFVQGGTGVGDRLDYQFLTMGVQAGWVLTPLIHAGPLSGRFELGARVMPLWLAFTPAPYSTVVDTPTGPIRQYYGGGTFHGVSVEPVIFRWNFEGRSQRFVPWFQAGGGSIYTTHKFPPTLQVPKGTPGGTSVFNFSPQGGIGFHYFPRPKRSWDFGLNAEHISSASLGDRNPGVNASLMVQVGYSWWK